MNQLHKPNIRLTVSEIIENKLFTESAEVHAKDLWLTLLNTLYNNNKSTLISSVLSQRASELFTGYKSTTNQNQLHCEIIALIKRRFNGERKNDSRETNWSKLPVCYQTNTEHTNTACGRQGRN